VRCLRGVEDRLDRLLLGGVDEAAGVDDDDVRRVRGGGVVTGGPKARGQSVGVGLVLGAAERLDEEGAARGGSQR
jgi:hypothetical protein